MSSITPNQLKQRLEAHATQCYSMSLRCADFSPTVKGPVDAAQLASIIKYAVLENPALEIAAEAKETDSVLTKGLRAIFSDESAKTEPIDLFRTVAETAVEHELGRAFTRDTEPAL
jgi:hypothetical protein